MSNALTAIDLFSGCGGLTEGLKQAGFTVIAGAEIRAEARQAYLMNHKKVHVFEDVRTITLERLSEYYLIKPGELDLLAACPPCQGFSTLRTLNRLKPADDDRNKLIFQVSRLAEELLPRSILVENVPGLLHDWRIDNFQRRLKKLGYRVTKGVLNAKDFGVPQRRRRMILVALRGDIDPTIPKPLAKRGITVRETIGNLPVLLDEMAAKLHSMRQQLSAGVLERVKDVPKDGGSRHHLGRERQLQCHQESDGFKDVYGRLSWDKVSSTITRFSHNPSKGRFLHPEEDRGLSLYESMLLQGFPTDYKLPTSLGTLKTSSLIGEAFPPPFARAQAEHIKVLLESLPKS
ncbi:MAG: DNA cytosine methyltransferase [Prosthecobacter sp.]|uniref:DNA cytosine methyltransferase n=1 Tax=Prosthecobacter sp. TaxID=1965333 RepID=UPI00260A6BA7|nr:DNA cytosine methyltransferase [Prosthecobacter sp.]MCF7789581.1 DNA cytosine methyltransferase [Prosthecobacter sp.]